MARRYASAAEAAERYVELLSKLTSAGALDYSDTRVSGGQYYTEPEGLDELMALEYAIGKVIHGRYMKALVWKDVLFMKMSLRDAAQAHNARVLDGTRVCKSTVDNWVRELNARFEEALGTYG